MTTVQITLPDRLAQDAERAGLLTPELLERWLRTQLKAQRADDLLAAAERMDAMDDPVLLTPDELAREIALLRAKKQLRP